MTWLPVVLAICPFLVFLGLLLIRKTPLIVVSATTFLIVAGLAVGYWRILPEYLIGSLAKGFLVAVDIFCIIFGAVFFLEIMKKAQIIENAGIYLETISKDVRIQVIFLAWFFENFLEGTAGFGTPSTVVAPLLVGLGINPINAVIIALLGNSSSVVFGAVGAPIRIGFGELAGPGLPFLAAAINLIGIIVPVFMLWFLVGKRDNGKTLFWEGLPFAVWSGVAFVVPSILTVFLGQEFPSILGSVIGLGLVLVSLKMGVFKSKNILRLETDRRVGDKLPLGKVIFPYLLLIIFLVIGKLVLGSGGMVVPMVVRHTIAFFNPGFAFILAGVTTMVVLGMGMKTVGVMAGTALKRSIEPFLVIAFMSATAQIMVNSVYNQSSLPSMIESMAMYFRNGLLPLWAPLIGAFGSFLTGSSTVSNLMFGNFLASSAKGLGLVVDIILALALVGGAAGNMIALADIVAAETVVGIKNEEKKILSGVIVPCAVYVVLVGLVGLILAR